MKVKPFIGSLLSSLILFTLPAVAADSFTGSVGISWWNLRWDNDYNSWESTSDAWGPAVWFQYEKVYFSGSYWRSSFTKDWGLFKSDYDREDYLINAGYEFFQNPSVTPVVSFRYTKVDIDASYVAGYPAYWAVRTQSNFGAGLTARYRFGQTGLYILGNLVYYPKGTMKDHIHDYGTNSSGDFGWDIYLKDNDATALDWEFTVEYRFTAVPIMVCAGYHQVCRSFDLEVNQNDFSFDSKADGITLGLAWIF
jgi:hypothetical protein